MKAFSFSSDKLYRRLFFCSRGRHKAYVGVNAYICVNCSKILREMDTFHINFDHDQIICSVKAINFRDAVFIAIQQYNLNVKLGDLFTWCPENALAFENTQVLSLTESDINLLKTIKYPHLT